MRYRLLAALLAAGIALGTLLSAAAASANAIPPGNGPNCEIHADGAC